MSYYLNPEDFDTLSDYLNTHLDVHPTGAIGPARDSPLQCYIPTHSSYKGQRSRMYSTAHGCMEALSPRGVQRLQGRGIVFDRDIINTWRLPNISAAYQVFFWEQAFQRALAQETVFVVIEAFIRKEGRDILGYDALTLLTTFRAYLKTLTTHSITITISSIVKDMMEECGIYRGRVGEEMAWSLPDMDENVTDFVRSRDCWQYNEGCAPSVEVTFEVPTARTRDFTSPRTTIKLQCHYTWFPPVMTFHNLQNVTSELERFVLMPSMALEPPFSCMAGIEITYYVGQQETWLH